MSVATSAQVPARRHAVELGPRLHRAVVWWAVVVLATAALTLIFGWQPGGTWTPIANLLLWPWSAIPMLAFAALAKRGGILVGAGSCAFVGVTCALVVAVLPDAKMPVDAVYRQHYILDAVGTSAIVGLFIGTAGAGVRALVQVLARQRRPSADGARPYVAANAVQAQVQRTFRGSMAQCLQGALTDASLAAQNGYVPVTQHWSPGPPYALTVIYQPRPEPGRSG